MKIGKTGGRRPIKKAGAQKNETSQTKPSSENDSRRSGDVVRLSSDAIAAAGGESSKVEEIQAAEAVQAISSEASVTGPLPDPRATSKALIEKELEALFREIYL